MNFARTTDGLADLFSCFWRTQGSGACLLFLQRQRNPRVLCHIFVDSASQNPFASASLTPPPARTVGSRFIKEKYQQFVCWAHCVDKVFVASLTSRATFRQHDVSHQGNFVAGLRVWVHEYRCTFCVEYADLYSPFCSSVAQRKASTSGRLCTTSQSNVAPPANLECFLTGQCLGNCAQRHPFVRSFRRWRWRDPSLKRRA